MNLDKGAVPIDEADKFNARLQSSANQREALYHAVAH